ncbi:MAG: alpha/beta fold hydrolase [Planctomycetes bacterium]|nr:alpha/beta fold hydrolase [Planctomycetota bacterium]
MKVNGEQVRAPFVRSPFTVTRMRLLYLVALVALIGIAGCGKKSEPSKATASAARPDPSALSDESSATDDRGLESPPDSSSPPASEQSLLDGLPTLPIPGFLRQGESEVEPESEASVAADAPQQVPASESWPPSQDKRDALVDGGGPEPTTLTPDPLADQTDRNDGNPLRTLIGRRMPAKDLLWNPLRDTDSAGAAIRSPRSNPRQETGVTPPKSAARLLAPPLIPDARMDAESSSETVVEPSEPPVPRAADLAPGASDDDEKNSEREGGQDAVDRLATSGEESASNTREAEPLPARAIPDAAAPDAPSTPLEPGLDGAAASAPGAPRATENRPDTKSGGTSPGLNTVRVYYGTDRRLLSGVSRGAAPLVLGIVLAVISIVAASCIYSRRKKLALACAVGGLSLGGLLVLGTGTNLASGSSTPRPSLAFGAERGSLQYGYCDVSIPPIHQTGNIERPSILRLEFREREDRHIVLQRVEPLPAEKLFQEVRGRVRGSSRQDLFVFVHGYNVTFDAAARRTAQMAHDLEFDGAPIFFSWPSQGELSDYMVDETSVAWSTPHLKQFLLDVVTRSDAQRVHLIAHSMGSRAMASAVQELAAHFPSQPPLFNEVILAAPDIDADEFRSRIAPAIRPAAERITLYASSNDQALMASRLVHGYSRAGESGANLLILPGIETIDVSLIDHSILGHSYYGSSGPVLRDIQAILRGATSANSRPWLRAESNGPRQYWRFDADRSIVRRPN